MLTKMIRKRRKYDEEFKKRAVRMSYSSERTITDVAKSLGISNALLYRWRKKYTPQGDQTRSSLQQEEVNSLHSRISELEEENYILKKASAFFAQNQK
jgi:transposase